ncbi:PIN domain-containing protein [Streptomyces sp. NPDC088745]|uniref:PIN domain-containing protein n=1 Tax=Streptomyces sp. NPDC088745 TaxID=3365884 RepID=UPI00382D374F
MTAPLVGNLVLDCQGLSKLVGDDREVTALVRRARDHGARVVTSAMTAVEARNPTVKQPRFDWVLSRIEIEPVTEDTAREASALLAAAGLHGHKYAIDAVLTATALQQPGPVVVLTSDPDDLRTLSDRRVRTVKV